MKREEVDCPCNSNSCTKYMPYGCKTFPPQDKLKIDVNSVTQVPELKELLDAQRKILHNRLNESLRFEDESERSDFVLDIMSDLPYPYCENFIPWISVDDKLPPEEEDVFVCAKSDVFVYYGVGYLCDGTWMDGEFAKIDDHKVTHWMPLIEPKLK